MHNHIYYWDNTQSMAGFTWKRGAEKNLLKKIYRLQRELATNHPDKLITNNQDCKQQKNKEPLLKHCKEKLEKEWEAYQRKIHVPETAKPARFNRG